MNLTRISPPHPPAIYSVVRFFIVPVPVDISMASSFMILCKKRAGWLVLGLFALGVAPLWGHVPVVPGKYDSIGRAHELGDVQKSWAVYNTLKKPGEVRYYKFRMKKGEPLKIKLFLPPGQVNRPMMMILDPAASGEDCPPGEVTLPPGYGFSIVETHAPGEPEYEPFTPAYFYPIAEYEAEALADGIYYLALMSPAGPSRFGMGIGFAESFTFFEWIRVPLDVVGIHLWEGESLFFIMAPLVLAVLLGFLPLVFSKVSDELGFRWRKNGAGWSIYLAALCYLGGSGMILLQVFAALVNIGYYPAMWISLIMAILPLPVALYLLNYSLRPSFSSLLAVVAQQEGQKRFHIPLRRRLFFAVFGLLGLLLWAGFYLGPALLFWETLRPGRLVHRGETSGP